MPRKPEPIADRIARRLIPDESGCLIWTGARASGGYGLIKVPTGKSGGQMKYVHRLAYELVHGPVSTGLVLDHLCRNPACANVEHLEPVTNYENIKRGNGAVARFMTDPDHCMRGHEFTPENTIIIRRCRTCENAVKRQRDRRMGR